MVDMETINRLRGSRFVVIPLDKPTPNKAQLIFNLFALLQMPEEIMSEAMINFQRGMDKGILVDGELRE